jgi:hypothetical protein
VLIDRLRVRNGNGIVNGTVNGMEVFRLDGTVRNGNVTVFMPPTVCEDTSYKFYTTCVYLPFDCNILRSSDLQMVGVITHFTSEISR